MKTEKARVFVTTYSIYNQGKQFASNKHGFWIDVEDLDFDQLTENFNSLDPICSNDHEFMFTDYENFPSVLYSESGMDFEAIKEFDDLADDKKEVVELLLSNRIKPNVQSAIDSAENYHIFEGSLYDYGYAHIEDGCYEIDEYLRDYLDFEAIGRDLYTNGEMVLISHNRYLVCYE